MNYFLALLLIGIAGFAYYQHNQDELQVADLQQQIANLKKGEPASTTTDGQSSETTTAAPDGTTPTGTAPSLARTTPSTMTPSATTPAAVRTAPSLAPELKVIQPTTEHSSAIDQAAQAATAAATSNSNNIGTVTTLDGRTFHNCKVLKVETDGVTFSHDDGITKVLFPLLPPNVQKQFDYDPQKAVAQTDAQVRYDQQQAAAAAAASHSTPAPANP